MGTSLLWGTFLPVVGLVFVIGAIVSVAYRSRLTVYHVPAIVLTLLAISVGISTAAGVFSLQHEADQTTYSISECNGPQTTSTVPQTTPSVPQTQALRDSTSLQFDSLSPDAKDVFRAALEADGEYTTTTRPEDFVYQDDTGSDLNYIQYESECYALHADSGGGLGIGLMIGFLLIGGGVVTLVLFSAGLASVLSDRFKVPVSILSGVGAIIAGFTRAPWPTPEVLVGTAIATVVVTWVVLRAIESRGTESFRERMDV